MLAPPLPIETERLHLRPWSEDDFDALLDIQSRPEVTRYLLFGPRGPEEVRESLGNKMGCTKLARQGDWLCLAAVLRSSGELVGDVNLVWESEQHRHAEIGFAVHPAHQGQGLGTEAMRPLVALGFEELGLHRITGSCDARNAASARLMEKLGMRREAHLVENEYLKDEWQSELIYAILDREWRAKTR